MLLLVIAFVFIFGLVIGSFLNVLIYRTIHGESPWKGRSMCPRCKKQIAWYDNIPLFSYLILQGRCRNCGKSISRQYPVVELLTGALFVWWYVVGFAFFQLTQQPLLFVQPGFWLIVGVLLLIILVTDWIYMIIPDYAVAGLGILALLYRTYLVNVEVMQSRDLWLALVSGVAACAFFWSLFAITKGKGMGFGDVKYALVMGWLLGWPRILVGIFCAFLLGGLVGGALLISKTKTLKQKIAFGPFLVVGTVIALVWGNYLWNWYVGFLY